MISDAHYSSFYRPGVFLSGNTYDIFFNVNAKKKTKTKCMQSNDKRISIRLFAFIEKDFALISAGKYT